MAVEPVLAVDVPLGQVVQLPTVAAPVAPLYVPFGHAAKSKSSIRFTHHLVRANRSVALRFFPFQGRRQLPCIVAGRCANVPVQEMDPVKLAPYVPAGQANCEK